MLAVCLVMFLLGLSCVTQVSYLHSILFILTIYFFNTVGIADSCREAIRKILTSIFSLLCL